MSLRARHAALGAAALLIGPAIVSAQAIAPSVFVINNVGNTLKSFRVNPDGTLASAHVVPTGANPQAVSLSADGKFLAVGHGTQSTTVEELRIFQVNADGTLTPRLTAFVPDSPLDVAWTRDNFLAVTNTGGGQNLMFRYDDLAPSLSLVDTELEPVFPTRLFYDRNRQVLYGNDLTTDVVYAYNVTAAGQLELFDTQGASPGAIDMEPSPNGQMMVVTSGATATGGRLIQTFKLNANGSMEPGTSLDSPQRFSDPIAFSPDSNLVFVGHNDAEVVVSFFVDSATAALTPTGFEFDVGDELSQGEIATLGNLLFVLDESSALDGLQGIYALRYDANGQMTNLGLFNTDGARPMDMAVWVGIPEPGTVGALSLLAGSFIARRRR